MTILDLTSNLSQGHQLPNVDTLYFTRANTYPGPLSWAVLLQSGESDSNNVFTKSSWDYARLLLLFMYLFTPVLYKWTYMTFMGILKTNNNNKRKSCVLILKYHKKTFFFLRFLTFLVQLVGLFFSCGFSILSISCPSVPHKIS